MRIRLLTTGSRGDIQPFMALGCGLQQAGHDVRVAAPVDFEDFITGQGLDYGYIGANMQALTDSEQGRDMLSNPLNARKYWRTIIQPMLSQIMDDAWEAARDAEVLIYNPKVMAGSHIVEKLGIPAFTGLLIPGFYPTTEFPNPITPQLGLGRLYNRISHLATSNLTMLPFKGIINDFRTETLGLPPVKGLPDETEVAGEPVPALFAYSQHVVPKPADWPAHTHITGYWFLQQGAGYQPPADLVDFLEAGPPPVYVGFGSMPGLDAREATATVLEALRRAEQRAVLTTGWGALSAGDIDDERVYAIDRVPHDWLFQRVQAVIHHGGAGTTAAGLRAGRPTVICTFFGDQPFWGERVHQLGVGPEPLNLKKLDAGALAAAISTAATDTTMQQQATALGEQIRAEDGVGTAVRVVEEHAG